MTKNNKANYYSISKVAILLDCNACTIKRWYKWADENNKSYAEVGLPNFTHLDNTKTKYFTETDITQLQQFRKTLKWGEMAKFNAKHHWSKNRKEI